MIWQTILALLAAAAVTVLMARRMMFILDRAKLAPFKIFANVLELVTDGEISAGESIASHVLTAKYKDHPIELKTIADTLATRKLPSLWLMITLKSPIPIRQTLDLMMRPAGPTTFSNFDFLPETLSTPPGFPALSVLRSDQDKAPFNLALLLPHLKFFANPRAKELLIKPNGVRFVVQLAEAERVRYLVNREARFEDTAIDPDFLVQCLDALLELHSSLVKNV